MTRVLRGSVATPPAPAAGAAGWLLWVAPTAVPAALHRAVWAHLRRLIARDGLGPVSVRYFAPAVPDDQLYQPRRGGGERGWFLWRAPEAGVVPLGVTPGDLLRTIGINASLDGDGMIGTTVAHEVRHLQQRAAHGAADCAEAEEYALAYIRELLASEVP